MSRSLFRGKGYLTDGLVGNESKVRDELERMPAEQIAKASVETLTSKHSVEPLVLDIDSLKRTLENIKIDVSNDLLRGGGRGRGRIETDGLRLIWTVPYQGDSDLWDFTPSTHSLSFPHGEVSRTRSGLSGKLVISAEVPSDGPEGELAKRLNDQCEKSLSDISKYIERSTADVEGFNARLPQIIESIVDTRSVALEKTDRLASALGADFVERME